MISAPERLTFLSSGQFQDNMYRLEARAKPSGQGTSFGGKQVRGSISVWLEYIFGEWSQQIDLKISSRISCEEHVI